MSLSVRALIKAIRRTLGAFADRAVIEHLSRRDWASATFTGARHAVRITLDGPGADAAATGFVAGLDDHEFDLHRHFVASLALAGDRREGGTVELLVELLVIAAD